MGVRETTWGLIEGSLTSAGRWLNKESGIAARAWHASTTAAGGAILLPEDGGEAAELLLAFFFFFSSSPSSPSLDSADWPLLTQSEMAMMLKLAAKSIALGKYVPMLTKRSRCMSR